jgi:uncharacterized damage-inducible protein DinB
MTSAVTQEDFRYPIGKFAAPEAYTQASREAALAQMTEAPALLAAAVSGLTDQQLDTPYREGGWSIRQVVHHLADSHMQAYVRTKFVSCEENTPVKPCPWDTWATFADAASGPVQPSLDLIAGLHARWLQYLRALPAEAFAKTMEHPVNGPMSLDRVVALYGWHGRHHTAQITSLRQRQGW